MTILVGILCKDGVVIGSDSSVTFGTPGGHTIEQSARKIEVINGCMILAGTGQVGYGQRFHHQLTEGYAKKAYSDKPHIEIGKVMSQTAIKDFAETSGNRGQYGALVAVAAKKKPCLCEFAVADFQPEWKTDQIWYASMGSGQLIADPFLGLMRKVFWKDGMPTLADGVFAAVWTLQHTIDINAGGVNGPMHLATLQMQNGNAVARLLSEEELAQHQENVQNAEAHLSSYRDQLSGNVPGVPAVPVPE